MTIGDKIQKLRKKQGWTQEELAAQMAVSRQALSKWESGAAVPDTENVLQLSRKLAVSTDFLLHDEYERPEDVPAAAPAGRAARGRIIAGCCALGVGLAGALILGILASVFPAVHVESPVGVPWVRVYTGLLGFLLGNHLVWLFLLCCLSAVGGAAAIWLPGLRRKRKGVS